MSTPALDRLLTPDEAATILSISKRQVEDMARRGELPHIKVGKYTRFRRERLDAWIEENESL